jgi:serine/threonine protein kinase
MATRYVEDVSAAPLGRGTYGAVTLARDTVTGERVALKRVHAAMAKREGVPRSVLRELRILQTLRHPNIVALRDVIADPQHEAACVLVLEHVDGTLDTFLAQRGRAGDRSEALVRALFAQLLAGVAYLHTNCIMHRDLTPHNVLVDAAGTSVKICDFGLASPVYDDPARCYSPHVVTLWYRAPELLLPLLPPPPPATDARQARLPYGYAVDMWSLGCILGEMLEGRALFPYATELALLRGILATLGVPSPAQWPELHAALEASGAGALQLPPPPLPPNPRSGWFLTNPSVTRAAATCLRRLLVCNPRQRAAASDMLRDPWVVMVTTEQQ